MMSGAVETPPAPEAGSGTPETRNLCFGITISMTYVKSKHGIITAIVTVLSLIAFIIVIASRPAPLCEADYYATYGFFRFVTLSAFVTGVLNYFLYLTPYIVPWDIVDLVWCLLFAIFYFAGSIALGAGACQKAGLVIGAVAGFVCSILLGTKAFFVFQNIRAKRAEATATGEEDTSRCAFL